jgi:DNA-binding transcriptional MerR regulator
MAFPCSTKAAAKELGIGVAALLAHVQRGNIEPPAKDDGGRYSWSASDVGRARIALAGRRRAWDQSYQQVAHV